MSVRVRYAPSPTGMPHVGNLRTALITWLFARQNNGWFLLRIDDTDLERSKKEYEEGIEESLLWLGMNWDHKDWQRNRLDRYAEIIAELKQGGRLYPCYETAEELALKRKSRLAQGLPPIYDRASLNLSEAQIAEYEAQGRKPHWRFKLNPTPIEWDDLIRGPVKIDGATMSDPVLIREDGSPLYHLCSVIDDIDYDITHIVRGEDHVSNTATHIQMFEAIGHKPPQFVHLPLIADSEGGKLSKRLGSLSVQELRDNEGIEPMAVVSYMARLGTSEPIEALESLTGLVDTFSFSKFSRNPPKFDPDEILRLNAKLVHDLPFADAKDRLAAMGLSQIDEGFWNGVRANLERVSDIKTWWDIVQGPVKAEAIDREFLANAANVLPAAPWNEQTWKTWTDAVKEQTGRKGKELFMPLRQALTGMDHGPELAGLLPLLGPEKVRERLAA